MDVSPYPIDLDGVPHILTRKLCFGTSDHEDIGLAIFSKDERHRYTLTRLWGVHTDSRYVNFVMLNPSTATEELLDPTLRRCRGYATAWGFDGFVVTNLFAFRATQPKDMKAADDPIGPANNHLIERIASMCELVICGWGTHGGYRQRDEEVRSLLEPYAPHYLALTQGGQPRHPLYLPAFEPDGETPLKPRRWL